MSTSTLPDGLASRPLVEQDAAAVTALMAACELHDDGEVGITEEDIVSEWARPSTDLPGGTLGVFVGDRLVAYGEVYRGRRADVYVAPEARGRGIGTALLQWTWQVARAAGSSRIGQSVSDNDRAAVALLERHGYGRQWTSWILTIDLAEPPPPPTLPRGFEISTFVPGRNERAAYETVENAFNEWPDRDPVAYEDWAASTIRRPGFRPERLRLLRRGAEVLGVCLRVEGASDEGWVQELAVASSVRGLGLGGALLADAFAACVEEGLPRCELSTDSRTGALGLYEHVGMRVKNSYGHWSRPV